MAPSLWSLHGPHEPLKSQKLNISKLFVLEWGEPSGLCVLLQHDVNDSTVNLLVDLCPVFCQSFISDPGTAEFWKREDY